MAYIPLRKQEDYKPIVLLKENKENANNNMLLEAVHAFDEQYKWAMECAKLTYNSYLKGIPKIKVNFKNGKDNSIKGADITITHNIWPAVNASIEGISEECFCIIEIGISNEIKKMTEDDAVLKIWDAIVHELGHGNIYWKRYLNGQDVNDTPEEYEKWHDVITDDSVQPNDILYLFCYALYSTYYQEVQAFISQTYSNTVTILNRDKGSAKNITKEEFWNALVKTNTYQTYKSDINIAQRLLDSKGLRAILGRKLEAYGFSYGDKEIVSKCKDIIRKSNNALKAAYNNTYYYLHKNFEISDNYI